MPELTEDVVQTRVKATVVRIEALVKHQKKIAQLEEKVVVLAANAPKPKVKAEAPKKVNISAGVAVGMLLQKTQPIYPPIAKAARQSGTVVLQATISKTGSIENLHVISGPAMLQQAAMDAVRQWRYTPTYSDGKAVEVEFTINVRFSL